MSDHHRYKEFEQTMFRGLLGCLAVLILYLIVAAAGIVWLKVLLGLLTLGGATLGIAVLYRSRELLKKRSLWLSCGFFAVLVCCLVSLILNYPG